MSKRTIDGEPVGVVRQMDGPGLGLEGVILATAVISGSLKEGDKLYARPDPSEQRARALLAEVLRGEPEAYETTFYPDRHGPNMTDWVSRVRKELGQ